MLHFHSDDRQPPSLYLLCGILALCWLVFRAQKVVTKPVDEHISLLGLEITPTPVASLLDITTDSIAVHWKPPEQRNSVVKYAVRVNGIVVGEVSHPETSTIISGLLPGHFYTVRIVAINSANFQASSDALRVRTTTLSSTTLFPDRHSVHDGSFTGQRRHAPAPTLLPYRMIQESAPSSTAAVMVREHSGSHSQLRRNGVTRRTSPTPNFDQHHIYAEDVGASDEHDETIPELTEKLESQTREIHDEEIIQIVEKQEHQKKMNELTEERESLRQELKGQDEKSKDLKKEVANLERTSSTAQGKRAMYEKVLQQKRAERDKMADDAKRWDEEVVEMEAESVQLADRKEAYVEAFKQTIADIRGEQEIDFERIKYLEEQIRERGIQTKDLEGGPNLNDVSPNGHGTPERKQRENEEASEWTERLRYLYSVYGAAWNELVRAQCLNNQARQRLDYFSNRRGSQSGLCFPNYSSDGPLLPEEKHVWHQNHSGRGGTGQSNVVFARPDHRMPLSSLYGRNVPDRETPFQTDSPYFNTPNLMSTPSDKHNEDHLSPADVETLTGGALTSPTANGLLPKDLLGDDVEDFPRHGSADSSNLSYNNSASTPSSGKPDPGNSESGPFSPILPDFLPGLGAVPPSGTSEEMFRSEEGTNSPASVGRMSPSMRSSRRASTTNSHHYRLSDGYSESDRRSVRSASGAAQAARGGMFGELFKDFNRQRGKTSSSEGPALGSLGAQKSQSMPRQLDDGPKLDLTSARKGGLSGGLWGLSRKAKAAEASSTSILGEKNGGPSGRFAAQWPPWSPRGERASSPRRLSNYSTYSAYSAENMLPVPSEKHQPFGWSSNVEGVSYLGQSRAASQLWSSSYSSRRQSINSANQLHDIAQLDEDSQEFSMGDKTPSQAPIGTKPMIIKPSPSKQLNPNARDFRSRFGRERKTEKESRGKKKEKETGPFIQEFSISADDSSPPDSYKSKDMPPIIIADLIDETGNGSNPATPYESIPGTPLSVGKESFMSRITRKRSNIHGLKEKGSIFSRKSAQPEDNNDEEDEGSFAQLERSMESVTSSTAVEKRSSFLSFKKKGKKGLSAPSISETSMTSETGDDEESRQSAEE